MISRFKGEKISKKFKMLNIQLVNYGMLSVKVFFSFSITFDIVTVPDVSRRCYGSSPGAWIITKKNFQPRKVSTPYLKMISKTFEEVLDMDRPLTVDALADYVKKWFDQHLDSKTFITRAAYNKLLTRKTNAVIRAVRALSPKLDVALEISLRQKISQKCVRWSNCTFLSLQYIPIMFTLKPYFLSDK